MEIGGFKYLRHSTKSKILLERCNTPPSQLYTARSIAFPVDKWFLTVSSLYFD